LRAGRRTGIGEITDRLREPTDAAGRVRTFRMESRPSLIRRTAPGGEIAEVNRTIGR
jgi:hypothetical protein